jgi:hypothetical protein
MITRLAHRYLGWVACFVFTWCLAGPVTDVQAEDMKVEISLGWGTDDNPEKFKDYKPVDPKLLKKLRSVFKWKHYLEIKNQTVTLPEGKEVTLNISNECKLSLTNLGKSQIRVKLYGKGKKVIDRQQQITLGEAIVLGGDDENDTAWFIFLSRLPLK